MKHQSRWQFLCGMLTDRGVDSVAAFVETVDEWLVRNRKWIGHHCEEESLDTLIQVDPRSYGQIGSDRAAAESRRLCQVTADRASTATMLLRDALWFVLATPTGEGCDCGLQSGFGFAVSPDRDDVFQSCPACGDCRACDGTPLPHLPPRVRPATPEEIESRRRLS